MMIARYVHGIPGLLGLTGPWPAAFVSHTRCACSACSTAQYVNVSVLWLLPPAPLPGFGTAMMMFYASCHILARD